MHVDLERIASADEAARATVDRARSAADARLECARSELAQIRENQLRALHEQVDKAVAQTAADADREIARRRAQRERAIADSVSAAAARFEAAVDTYIDTILRHTLEPAP